jgi:hypothetical protein
MTRLLLNSVNEQRGCVWFSHQRYKMVHAFEKPGNIHYSCALIAMHDQPVMDIHLLPLFLK